MHCTTVNSISLFKKLTFFCTILNKTDEKYHSSSLSEGDCNKLIESEDGNRIVSFTNRFLIKVYPGGLRTDSSNLNPIMYWIYGFQIGKF